MRASGSGLGLCAKQSPSEPNSSSTDTGDRTLISESLLIVKNKFEKRAGFLKARTIRESDAPLNLQQISAPCCMSKETYMACPQPSIPTVMPKQERLVMYPFRKASSWLQVAGEPFTACSLS
ncbi:hypothetical protein DNTS_028590, partial [Danionella cerebrum]